jgi:hypothetical protein
MKIKPVLAEEVKRMWEVGTKNVRLPRDRREKKS